MLRTRVITALVLAPAAIALVFFAPAWAFRLVAALLLLIGSWEFRRLANLGPLAGWALFGLQISLIALMSLEWDAFDGDAPVILGIACLAWVLMFLRLPGFHGDQASGTGYQVISFISALLAISSCWFALAWLRDQPGGAFLILLLLIIIWAADVGAYFSGRLFGKTRLAPSISPKKTWEGVFGGILLAGVAAFVMSHLIPDFSVSIVSLLILTAVTVAASICGDLFISIHKRTVKLKDAGNLFPGHGGVLDRFDSLLPGATFFAMTFWILGS